MRRLHSTVIFVMAALISILLIMPEAIQAADKRAEIMEKIKKLARETG